MAIHRALFLLLIASVLACSRGHAPPAKADSVTSALAAEAARYFVEPGVTIRLDAEDTCRGLSSNGIAADPARMLEGALFLVKHTHYPENFRPGHERDRPDFRDFANQYQNWRLEGASHEATIAKLHELEKF